MPTPEDLRIVSAVAVPVLLLLGLARPVYAALGYMVLVYCKVSAHFPAYESMRAELSLGLLVLFLLLVRGRVWRAISFGYNRYNGCLAAFVACMAVSYMVALDHQFSWDNAVYHFIKVLVLYAICVGSISKEDDLRVFFLGFLLMFAYLTYEPIYGFMTGTGGEEHQYGTNYTAAIGILEGHVALANNMNQMIPMAYYLAVQHGRSKLRVLGLVLLCEFVFAMIGSGSRGGVLGFLSFGLVLVWFSENRARAGFAVGVCAVLLFLFTQLSYTASRLDQGNTLTERLLGLTHGVGMVTKGNVLGVGPGCYQLARRKYFGWGMQAHNIYGEVLGDLGLPGALAWFFLIRQIFLNLSQAKARLLSLGLQKHLLYYMALGLQASLVVRLIISMASHGLYFFYWYIVGAMSVALVKAVEEVAAVTENGPTAASGR